MLFWEYDKLLVLGLSFWLTNVGIISAGGVTFVCRMFQPSEKKLRPDHFIDLESSHSSISLGCD